MATNNNDEILKQIDELINSDGSVEIPGLTLHEVAENFVDAKYGTELAEVEDADERDALREQWVSYYENGDGKEAMLLEIANIKAKVAAAQDSLTTIAESAASTVATNTIPAVITTGAATSVPNPVHALAENKTKKNQLLAMLKTVGSYLIEALKSCAAIMFPIPTIIATLIQTFITVKKTVNTIPV
jgi:hypothetical protein